MSEAQLVPPAGDRELGAAILVHGFAGSPYDFEPLVEPLSRLGYWVVVPLVPGQTRSDPPAKRAATTADELVVWARAQVEAASSEHGRPPVVVGMSMGGTLATIVAAEGRVGRVALLAPYFGLPRRWRALPGAARLLAPVVPWVPKPTNGQIRDRALRAAYEPGAHYLSTAAFVELERLAELGRGASDRLEVPTLHVHSPDDSVASFERARRLLAGRPNVTELEVPRSDHVLLHDADRERVVEAVCRFLAPPAPTPDEG